MSSPFVLRTRKSSSFSKSPITYNLNRSLQADNITTSPLERSFSSSDKSGNGDGEREMRRRSVAALLRQTSRGRLEYDREWSADNTTPVAAAAAAAATAERSLDAWSPSASTSPSSASGRPNSWQSVMEEVTEEVHRMKVQTIYEAAKKCNSAERNTANKEEDATQAGSKPSRATRVLKRAEVIEDPCVEVHVKPLLTPPKQKERPVPDAERVISSPVSPVDDALLRLELQRQNEVKEAVFRKREKTRAALEQIRAKAEAELKKRIELAERKMAAAEEEARVKAEQDAIETAAEAARVQREQRLKAEEKARELKEAAREAGAATERLRQTENTARNVGMAEAELTSLRGFPKTLADISTATTNIEQRVAQLKEENAQKEQARRREQEARIAAQEKERLAAEAAAVAAEEARQRAVQAQQEEDSRKKQLEAAAAPATPINPPVTQTDVPDVEVSESNRQKYHMYLNYHSQVASITGPLASDPALKQFCFDVKKAVNTSVNAINATSSTHLKEKLDKLDMLLSGLEVDIIGDKRLNAASHPHGIVFAMDYAAEKFVLQGGEVISSKPEQAFSMAAVIVSLWVKFPDFGSLFMAHLYKSCSYLVPFNPTKRAELSEEQYHRLLGYKYDDDGKVEEADRYLKRMSGLARLYAAVCITAVTKAQLDDGKDHPHGLGNLWTWLASVMNLRPVAEVTATLLLDVLEVAGNTLWTEYRSMFKRLLELIWVALFPKIKEVTPEGQMARVSRLEEFLTKALTGGQIKKPEKLLPLGFM